MSEPVFNAVYADPDGRPRIAGDLLALGANGRSLWELGPETMCRLPSDADLLRMTGRAPVALDPATGEPTIVEGERGGAEALAAVLPVGYTRLLLPAIEDDGRGPDLPLYGYTAVAASAGELYAAALKTDDPAPWSPRSYDPEEIEHLIAEWQTEHPHNRVLAQLALCARDYHCRTAQNLFCRRGEAGLPAAETCNAACIGCISRQPAECCPAPQGRITFTPTSEELAALAVAHLEGTTDGIVSFGQGCEGEPLTVARLLAEVIRIVRRRTRRGTINLNTNAGLTDSLALILRAGLDSIRVSLFSADPVDYRAYHRPSGFDLTDVRASLRLAVEAGCVTNLNLLAYPGYTDSVAQTEALLELCRTTGLHRIQLRNLNIDPRSMAPFLREDDRTPGMTVFLGRLRADLPHVTLGNYTKA